jgi:branched-chain amino acid transport system substrate-binding protein
VFVVDELSLPRPTDLALGIPGTLNWVNDLPNEANQKFVADFIAKYKTRPSYYAAQTYDGVNLLDSAVSAVHGDLSKEEEMRQAIERADFKSLRATSSLATTTFRTRIFTCRRRSSRATITSSRRWRRSWRTIKTASTTNAR